MAIRRERGGRTMTCWRHAPAVPSKTPHIPVAVFIRYAPQPRSSSTPCSGCCCAWVHPAVVVWPTRASHPSTTAGRAVMVVMTVVVGGLFMMVVKMCHDIRTKLDGTVARAIGLGDAGVTVVQIIVNLVGGVQLCAFLSNDTALPSNPIDAVYWAVITGTSVGYGDHVPTTDNGKMAVCVYLLLTMQSWMNVMELSKNFMLTLHTVPDDIDTSRKLL
eukprot:m.108245 g.108245  ORF g.108245 m.108245 type:complete len:217 (+) comp21205_c0_seq2:72-722(+)